MNRLALLLIGSGLLFLLCVESKTLDPYKVLGVDRNASQREIQKAFHKLSLQYHPDKNKNKGAQEKFSEINNAYDILSDEQKRKNYDLYGDEKGSPGFDAGGQGGHPHFTNDGPGQGGFHFNPGGWENMGGQNGERSFSFSFGSPGSGKKSSFGFGFDDIFSNLFGGGMDGGSQFGGFGGSGRSQYRTSTSSKNVQPVTSKLFKKDIVNSGMTWLLVFHTSNHQNTPYYESLVGEVATSLEGALKVGRIDCESEASLCKELGVNPRREPKVFVYSYVSEEKGSLVEYDGDPNAKPLKSFCQDHLPKLSKRISLSKLHVESEVGKLPKLLLLSTKKNTPVIWRVLSGLYRKRFAFYDAQVHDVSDPEVKKLGVDSLPAIVGWLSNGEKQVLTSGISVKDLKSAIKDLSSLLDNFETKNKKASTAKKDQSESGETHIPLLSASNFNEICSNEVPVCLIGVFQSPKSREKLEKILRSVSQKSFSRRRSLASGSKDSVSYALLDASKHQSFLNSFDKNLSKSSDKLLVAYKPKRGTYATSQGEVTEEATEKFITSILNGDIQFAKTRQKPSLK